jgi:S1-C subfamily serine protease/predicted TPR repeat methyltransferase
MCTWAGVVLLAAVCIDAAPNVQPVGWPELAEGLGPTGQEQLQKQLSAQEIFQRVAPSIFVVEVYDGAGSLLATGSAVAVGPSMVATNKHVVTDADHLVLRRQEQSWTAVVSLVSPSADLCILRADGLQLGTPALVLRGSAALDIGERVYAVGAPRGLELTLSDGLVSGLRRSGDGAVVQITAPISPGSSGGGLFDAFGQLIGITTFSLRGSQNLNFALSVETLVSVLKQQQEDSAKGWVSIGDQASTDADSIDSNLDRFYSLGPNGIVQDSSGVQGWLRRSAPTCQAIRRSRLSSAKAYLAATSLAPEDHKVWAKLGSEYARLAAGTPCQQLERSFSRTASLDDPSWAPKMVEAFTRSVTLRPDDVATYKSFAEAYSSVGQRASAAAVYVKILAKEPKDASTWVRLAAAYRESGNSNSAVQSLQQAESLHSSESIIWQLIGGEYDLLKKRKEAHKAWQEALRLDPSNSVARIHVQLLR